MKVHAAAIAILFAAPLLTTAQQIAINKDNRTIAITTSDNASAMADVAAVTIGFDTYGKTQDGVYDDASRISNAIHAALLQAGASAEAIQSLNQGLRPLNSFSEEDRTHYAAGDRFTFTQSWKVTVPASAAATVLQAGIAAGGNNSGNIDWSLHDSQPVEAEAARKALEHARSIAVNMAQGLGARLGALIYAGNEAPPRDLVPLPLFARGMSTGAGAGMGGGVMKSYSRTLAVAPTRIMESATVYAVFAIE